jgi:hypothetical protein
VTPGCICALFAWTLILFAQYSIFQYAAPILVGCLIVGVLLLVFAVYVSLHDGRPCKEWTLAVLFFLFDIVILSFAIFELAVPQKVVRLVAELWDSPVGQTNLPIVIGLEDSFRYCGWSESAPTAHGRQRSSARLSSARTSGSTAGQSRHVSSFSESSSLSDSS